MKLFSGTANLALSQSIAKELGTQLGDLEIIRFADSECRVKLSAEVKNEEVFVIQPTSTPVDENLMELLLVGDAIKRANPRKLTAVIPYFGYQRQDKIHRMGEALSAKVAVKIIERVGYDEIIVVDPHSELLVGFFGIPVTSISAFSLFEPQVKEYGKDVIIVAPDAGGAKRAQLFARSLGAPLALIEKWRDLSQIHTTQSLGVIGDVQGKIAIIVDDAYVTGATTAHAASLLKERGAKEVIAFATQPVFAKDAAKTLQESDLSKVFTTDVIDIPQEKRFPKLTILPIAPLISESIKNNSL